MLNFKQGQVDLTSVDGSPTKFDYAGAGFAVQTGWVGSSSALLVQLHQDGQPTLFGVQSGDGFADLAKLDGNGDGVVDSKDSAFGQLDAWFDTNQDGLIEAGELKSLSDLGITSLGVVAATLNQTVNGNTVVSGSTFTEGNGTVGQIAEVDFATHGERSTFSPPVGFKVDSLAKALPQIHGYGLLPDLRTAMSLDSTLEGRVLNFVFSAPSMTAQQFDAAFTTLLYRWAGVDGIDPGAWGPNVDGRQFEFILKIFGVDPSKNSEYTAEDPNWHNGPLDGQEFQAIKSLMEVRFAAQLGPILSAIFPGSSLVDLPFAAFAKLGFNESADTVSLDLKPVLAALGAGAPSDATAAATYYAFAGQLLADLATDVYNQLGHESGLLLSRIALDGSQAGLSDSALQAIATAMAGGPVSVVDLANATGSYVASGGATIFSLGSANSAPGPAGSQAGPLTITGNGGSDVFIYWSNFGGNVVLTDANASLDLADLRLADVSLQRNGDDLVIAAKSTGATVTVTGEFARSSLSSLQFADGQVLGPGDISSLAPFYLGPGNINFQLADGPMSVVAGTGDDVIAGGSGDDTFIYGQADGNLTINDHDAWYQGDRNNTLKLSDLNAADVTLSRDTANDLLVTVNATGKVITVGGTFNSLTNDGIQNIAFADGTVLTHDQITVAAPLRAGAGDVTLQAPDGDVTLVAGTGDDTFNGGSGDDTFIYDQADGNLTINDHDAWYQGDRNNTLKLSDLNAADVTLSRDTANDLLVTVNATGKVITAGGTFNSLTNDGIQNIAFADGTVLTHDQITVAAPLRAGAGDVTLQAPDGDVTLMAGTGDDTFNGGSGDDTFIYGQADGNLTINDHDAWYQGDRNNTLKLSDLNAADVTLSRDTANDLLVTVNATGKVITAGGTFNSLTNDGIQNIAFADGTILTRDQITVAAPLRAGAGDVTLQAPDGDVALMAGTGDDTFNGGSGNDTFIYGQADGNLTINDHDAWYQGDRNNTLKLSDLNAADVTLSRDTANDLLVTVNATGKVITAGGTFNSLTNDGIQNIAFADGTILTRDQITVAAPLRAGAGDVTLQAPDGDVALMAGTGDDTFNGGSGDDTFIYGQADGNLTINDHDAWYQGDRNNTLKLSDLNAADVTLSRDTANDLLVTVNATGKVITAGGTFNSLTNDGIQNIAFADGTILTRDQITVAAPLRAGAGDVTLQAPDGDVALMAGTGDDTFNGGSGDDTFIYGQADGNLTINDHDAWYQGDRNNTLKLSDLNAADVTLSRDTANDLLVTVNATGKVITAGGTFNSLTNDGIQNIAFADGTILTRDQITVAAPLRAGAGDVTLQAPDGDVALMAGTGDDTFNGGSGDDTFIYGQADGNLTINDHDAWYQGDRNNTLKLSDLNAADVTLSRDTANDLLVTVNATGKVITAGGTFNSLTNDGIQNIAFADGTILTRDQITVAAPLRAGAGDVTLQAPDGDVALMAGTGDDTFNGGSGDDTFIYGQADGNLTINDHDAWYQGDRNNTLKLSDLNTADVTLSRDTANDLLVTVNATGKVITAGGTFNSLTNDGIQNIAFADGTVLTHDQITVAAPLRAGAGDVTLQAPDGDVTLVAGTGDDTFNGGSGDDTFIYGQADGNLTINDHDAWYQGDRNNTLKLSDLNAADVTLLRTLGNDLLVTVNATGKVITVGGTFNSLTHDGIQEIAFADGTVWDRDQLTAAATVQIPDNATNTYVQGSNVSVDLGKGGGYITHYQGETSQTYLWAKGDGNDVISVYTATGSTDVLKLTDVDPSGVQLSRSGNDLFVKVLSSGETIEVAAQWYDQTTDRGASLEFADGTVWDRDQITASAPVRPGPGGVVTDPSDVEVVFGSDDGSSIQGHGTSHGLKLDWTASSGSATAWFWSDANRAEGNDPSSISLTDLNPSDVTLSQVSDPNWGGAIDNLLITNNTTGKTLEITREFSGYSGDGVGSIHFADGTVLDHDQIAAQAAHDQRAGPNDVTLTASDGAATLTSGAGNNTFFGGNGSDTFVYAPANGNLTISAIHQPSWGDFSNKLVLNDLSEGDISLTQHNNDLVIAIAGTGKTIDVVGQFDAGNLDGIGQIQLAGGTVWSRNDIDQKLH